MTGEDAGGERNGKKMVRAWLAMSTVTSLRRPS